MNTKIQQIVNILATMTVAEFGEFLAFFNVGPAAGSFIEIIMRNAHGMALYRITERVGGPRKKIQGIKRIREITGWGLKESKDFIDGATYGNLAEYSSFTLGDLYDDLYDLGYIMEKV